MGRKMSQIRLRNPKAERQIKNVSKCTQKAKLTRARATRACEKTLLRYKTTCESKTHLVGVLGGEATAFLPLTISKSIRFTLKNITKALKVERPKAIVPWLTKTGLGIEVRRTYTCY